MLRESGRSASALRFGLTLVWLMTLIVAGPVWAAVRIVTGPTPILKGDARAAGDLTVVNEKLAFALAVHSPVPYGVPRGALVDLAPVTNGKIGRDRVVFADFIPNNWSAWPNTYQHIDIVQSGPARVEIRTTRDWGKATVVTVYVLETNSDHVDIRTTLTNGGDVALTHLLAGLTLWPNSGFLFAVPGMQGVPEGSADAPLAHRMVAYDEDWAIALHADYFDHIGDESRDLYALTTLAPGQSASFEGWLQVRPSGDLAPVVRAEIERGHLAAGSVHGVVLGRDAKPIGQPVVVVEKHGAPYAWVIGRRGQYDIDLPLGEYSLYATAKNASQSARVDLTVRRGANRVDFRNLDGAGRVEFAVTNARDGAPLDARIIIAAGQKPSVQFLGRQTFFTDLDTRGHATVPIAPGRYLFNVSSGGGFLGPSEQVAVNVAPGGVEHARIGLTRLFDPPATGWYSADLHHHADQAEAVTPPADLARSQFAAGLDLLFVGDHDSTVNHEALQRVADRRGVPFIAGVELSPSWGHFNAYPLKLGQGLAIDTSVASIDDILQEARRQGAIVVQVNHPFIPYGYFTSVAGGVAPGGFNPGFDLMEMNQTAPEDDDKVAHALWDFWNAGKPYYLSAGTDTHDVWNFTSGEVRVLVHVDGRVTAQTFAENLKAGHAYVTHGPLIVPATLFGDRCRLGTDQPFALGFDLQSVDGLKRVELIGAGVTAASQHFDGGPQRIHVSFPLPTPRAAWYALVVEDVRGKRAYTNPIWIDGVDRAPEGSSLSSEALGQPCRCQVCDRPRSENPI